MSPLVVVATFLASGVEWVEAFTIVLAVGLFGGWRPALTGTGLAALALGAIVVAAGTAVNSFPVAAAQIVVGVFLLLFGLRWLHKAIETYRVPSRLVGTTTAAGVIPRRLAPIFRDRDELPSATDLGGKVDEALAASANLIVICSPAAATSRWVDAEVRA